MKSETAREIYLFLGDYLHGINEALKELRSLSTKMRIDSLPDVDLFLHTLEVWQLRIQLFEETKERLLEKCAVESGVSPRSIDWGWLKREGGREISDLGESIENALRTLSQEMLTKRIVLDRMIMINQDLSRLAQFPGGEASYTSKGTLENTQRSLSLYEEV